MRIYTRHPDHRVVLVSELAWVPVHDAARAPALHSRSRKVTSQFSTRDEIYRLDLSNDGDDWEFTSVMIEEARDGSSHDLAEVSEQEAREIMERTRDRRSSG
jgi:hypothetical protein